MRNFIFTTLAISVLLISGTSISSAADIDIKLVGDWQGQRELGSKCSFLAWKLNRTIDGKFVIVFYTDSNKSIEENRENGRWWVKDNKYFTQTEGVATPDGYSYYFLDKDAVRYTVLIRDPSADCAADYEFVDHRVVQTIKTSEQVITCTGTSNGISAQALRFILGKHLNSREVVSFLENFDTSPKISGPYFDSSVYYSWEKYGISLMFKAERLTTVFLYADNTDGFSQYKGEIPDGMEFFETRQSIEERFGIAKISGGTGVIPFWVYYPEKGIGITYKTLDSNDKTTTISNINLQQPKGN